MRHLKLFLLMTVLPLLAVECQEEPFSPEMPEPTQEGQDMVAAKINGAIWELKGSFPLDQHRENPEVVFSLDNNTLGIWADRKTSNDVSHLIIRTNQISGEGFYNSWGTPGSRNKTMWYAGGGIDCHAVKENPGSIHIDYINENDQIIAGRFEFDGLCEDGDTIKVRDGWFDLNY